MAATAPTAHGSPKMYAGKPMGSATAKALGWDGRDHMQQSRAVSCI